MPYIDLGPWSLFGLQIHLFGILVATGVVVGSWLGARYAEKHAIDVDWLRWAAFRIVVVGFIICHIIDVVFYQPDRLAKDPLLLLKIWQGISSYGGFIGGLVGFLWYTRNKYEPPASRLEIGDCCIYGFAPGFWFGRMACTTAHDHAGRATDFMFGVDYPAGAHHLANGIAGRYHDLGLYEAMFLMPAIVLGVFLLSLWKGRKPGLLISFATMVYAVPRFFFDFLRFPQSDPRYFGLTAAQFFSIAMFFAGAYLLVRVIPRQPKTTFELAKEREEAASRKKKSVESGDPPERKVAKATAKPSGQTKRKSGSKNKKRKS